MNDWDMQADWTNGSGHVCLRVTDKYTVSKLIKKGQVPWVPALLSVS